VTPASYPCPRPTDPGASEYALAFDRGQAVRLLGEITGAEINEAVLERVFSRFCIGK